MQLLEDVSARVQRLIAAHRELRVRVRSLEAELRQTASERDACRSELQQVQQQALGAGLSALLEGDAAGRAVLRKNLDDLIGGIDAILSNLQHEKNPT